MRKYRPILGIRSMVLLLEFGLLAAIAVLPANAEVNQSWENLVNTVKVGKSVAVKNMNSVQIEGKLLAITAESITVEYAEKRYVFAREEVLRVRYAKIRRNHALIGMVIGGAAVGTFVGRVAYVASGKVGAVGGATGGAGVGFVLGAAVGAALPIGPPLYEATRESTMAWLNNHASPQTPAATAVTAKP